MAGNPALDWKKVEKQTKEAIKRFMLHDHGAIKKFVNVKHLVDYLYAHPDPVSLKLITGETWDTIEFRCASSMRRMGWDRHSKAAYVIPEEVLVMYDSKTTTTEVHDVAKV